MYLFKNLCLEQMNISVRSFLKPGINLCVHWLNHQSLICERELYPDKI